MTQEQFEKAIQINRMIQNLKSVQEEIKGTEKHKLSYLYKTNDGYGSAEFKPCCDRTLSVIGDIFDKHDLMIREEIEEEIKKLEKEIEEL